MKKRFLIYGAAGVLLAAIVIANNTAPLDNVTAQKILQEMMKQKGLKAMAPPKEYLQTAVTTGDNVKIARAFNDMVYAGWPPDQVISALKDFLDNSNPFVRYLAGQYLFVVGDKSGYNTLLALVQSNAPLEGLEGTGDLRVQAAAILAQFRQSDATQAIYNLYQQTNNGELIEDLQKLAPNQVGTLIPPKDYYNDPSAIRDYGIENDRQFIPQITSTFYNTQKPELKVAAAYALATMTNDQNAIAYLLQASQAVINRQPIEPDIYRPSWQVINYLGTIQTPQAKQTLEAALDSTDPSVVQTAALNLIFNQGGSDKVNQMVAAELKGPPNLLGADLALNLATTQMLNDPKVQAAGQYFSQHDGSGAWQRAIYRKNWSTYNWMSGLYIAKPSK